ncbi:hypothetical protein F511_17162 [Dorcoceras hygrometricum]|uniref:Uncharacterized protein n=1 Tax=Dorcoceras hygrometricum TaxID=472368 RepID=A0A2Z7C9T0_9LAMI|nr:hypothetical protein F511_17162 [Dorcoceras hygrometricum]
MQRRRDQQPHRTIVLPDPATTAGALPAGPPPGPVGPNLTDHGSNRACMKENDPLKSGTRRCAGTCSARCSPPSPCSGRSTHIPLVQPRSCSVNSDPVRSTQILLGQPRSCSIKSYPVRSTQILFGQSRSCSVNSDLRQPTQLVNSQTVNSADQQSDSQHSWSTVNSALDWSTQLWTVNSDLANSDLGTEIQIW